MKTIINKFFLVSAVVMALTACSDFLDKEPLSQGTEAIVFKTPEHFEQAANALYNVIGWKNLDDKPSYDDIMDRGTDISGLGSNGGGSAPEENWSWDKPYSHIRTCNILLEKAEAYDGSQSDIAQSVGVIKALRKYTRSVPVRKEKAENAKTLGEVLKQHRLNCKMTQEFVAETLGVSRQAVSKWESGASAPSTTNLMALAKVFDVSAEELLKETQKN